jgi:ATP-binding cassette subfamily C protein
MIINLLMLTGPLFMLQIYDRVLTSRSLETLTALTILVAVLLVFLGILELIRSRILVRIGRFLDERVGAVTYDAVLAHALSRTPQMGTQPLRDLDTVRTFASGPGPAAFFDVPWTPIFLVVIFLFHPWLGWLATAGAVVLFLFALANEVWTRTKLTNAAQASVAGNTMAEEARQTAEAIVAMGMTDAMRNRWLGMRNISLTAHQVAADRGGSISAASRVLRLFLQSGVLALGAYLAVRQEITPGTMIAASIIGARALAPIEQAIVHWRGFHAARKAYRQLALALAKLPGKHEGLRLPAPRGHVSVEGLAIAAPGTNQAVIGGINFSLKPGTALGILGPTGCGKTTLARALVGVWPPARGTVRLDGAELEHWRSDQLGRAIGYLPQHVELFSGTVAQNISRFDAEPNHEFIVDASRQADVFDLILRLPDGYDSLIGESGLALSAGQRQRIGLARALYGQPALVVLDEPNASLDAEGEAAVIHAIEALKEKGSTVVVIAHRPSAIRAVDQILFLTEGKQVAFGPRDEVLARILKAKPIGGRENVGVIKGQ